MFPSEQDFQITIKPCPVTSIIDIQVVSDVTYRIGGPDVTWGTYSFQDQPNACGYEQTIEVTGMPAFVTHDEENRQFILGQTFDHS